MIRQKIAAEEAVEENGLKGYPNGKASDQMVFGMGGPLKVKVRSRCVKGSGITAQITSVTHFNGNKTVRSRRQKRQRTT